LHFNGVPQTIVVGLNQFVKKELEGLAASKRENQRLLKEFRASEDEYVSLKSQVALSRKQKVEQSLRQSHTCSALAFFEFHQKMEEVERKLRSFLPHTFLMFLTSISNLFRDCLASIGEQEALLNAAQTSVQQVNLQLQEFSQHSVQMKQRLSGQIPTFWNKLFDSFARTTQTFIQSYLWKKSSSHFRLGRSRVSQRCGRR
jgi:hypothetical protein